MQEIIETICNHWAEQILFFAVVIGGIRFLIKGKKISSPLFSVEENLTKNHMEVCHEIGQINDKLTQMQGEIWRLEIHDSDLPMEERVRVAQLYQQAGFNGETLNYVKNVLLKRRDDNQLTGPVQMVVEK